MIRTERKYIEILRILKEHQDPIGAKRLSELMAERGLSSVIGQFSIISVTLIQWIYGKNRQPGTDTHKGRTG